MAPHDSLPQTLKRARVWPLAPFENHLGSNSLHVTKVLGDVIKQFKKQRLAANLEVSGEGQLLGCFKEWQSGRGVNL